MPVRTIAVPVAALAVGAAIALTLASPRTAVASTPTPTPSHRETVSPSLPHRAPVIAKSFPNTARPFDGLPECGDVDDDCYLPASVSPFHTATVIIGMTPYTDESGAN